MSLTGILFFIYFLNVFTHENVCLRLRSVHTLLHSEPCLSKGFRVVSFEPKTIAWDVWCNTNVHHIQKMSKMYRRYCIIHPCMVPQLHTPAHFCDEKPVKNMAGRWAGLVFTCSLPLCCVYAPQIYIRICIMQLAMVHYQGKKCSWSGGGGCKTRVRKIKTDSSMWG